ncbi:MAG: nucleotide exchange factor GrpE [Firmicutes bacterium HGW-Firmicutes-9]|jgi:molecular chaperone GrpE|nr:MAG: nucleotide exchange factor GrpE [Firmicutes bacterium HGW-Firmicutes-9]
MRRVRTDKETVTLTKKTDKHEPVEETIQTEAATNAEPTVVKETASEQDSYTLTAEEFEAAKAHIEAITKEKDETVVLLQRIQADFDNFRRRNASIRLDSYEEGKRDTVKELLPALDNLERALDAIPAENASLREGIAMVQRQMLESLKKLGLEEVESDCIFDPTKHEAVMREKVDGKESGEIVVVFQKGYRMGGRIIRHCMVKVAE